MHTDLLREIEKTLADIERPPGVYVRSVQFGNLLFLAGTESAGPRPGKVGAEISLEEARAAARCAGMRLLAVVMSELGGFERVARVLQVRGFVNAAPTFSDHPRVIDGCSELFVECFGELGRHVRTSVGVSSLPGGIPVEVEAIIGLRL
ncbi:MAG: RidA family protein [Alphaproteobacteria bacterium]|nr:RidA family protein [Alphaproteobacteria bacterium]